MVKTFVLSSAVQVLVVLTPICGVFTFILGEFQVLIFSEAESTIVPIFRRINTMYLLMTKCELCFIGPPGKIVTKRSSLNCFHL